ncbi:P22 coat protein - protein 5 domain protein [Ruoffia sp. FAM 24228]|uniref:phage major capsid protein n=1 Tax=Ruoffia sp. FAM 24228 TaxID=3259517 RepID=UPI0038876199
MTMKNFIPTIWSARLANHLDANLSALAMVNTDYQGEIANMGDTVKINQFGNVTVSDYNGTLGTPETLTSTQQTLVIDTAKSYNFIVDDIEEAQSNISIVDNATERAGVAMAEQLDKDLYEVMATGAGIKVGSASTPIEVDKDNIYDTIVDLGVTLNEKNVSKANRRLVLPPFAIGLLAKDSRFTKNETVLASGVVGRVGGFDIIESNNLKATTNYTAAVGGNSKATSFANQVVKSESNRATDSFGDIVRGLNVYGRKVVSADELAVVYIKLKPAEAPAG